MSHKSQFSLYTDGGARGNPGPGGIGVVIKKGDEVVFQKGKSIGHSTNNQAEYKALILGLEELSRLTEGEVVCFLDSELIVKQLNGEYRVKDEGLKPLFSEVLKLKEKFARIKFEHIKREKNKLADSLVNQALDGRN